MSIPFGNKDFCFLYNCNKLITKLTYRGIMFIKKYLKWISTALVLIGILLTNLNIYPINIYFHGLGVIGWTIAGFISKDKAILTNFGLQIPLFLMGIYKVIF